MIGNCQARGVAQAMRLLVPESPVRFIQMAYLKREHGHLDYLGLDTGAAPPADS